MCQHTSFIFNSTSLPRPTKTCSPHHSGWARSICHLSSTLWLVNRTVIHRSSMLVNTSNAAVSEPERKKILRSKPHSHPPLQLSHLKWEVEGRRARASLWKRCWHPILEICRAERINGSPLGQTDGRWRKWPLRGEERSGWGGWVAVVRGRCPLGESRGGGSTPGHLLKREQLRTLGPREEGHCGELAILYKPKPEFSCAAFTLHRSAITKPIKKPRRGASVVSQSPLFDLATRITAEESTSQRRKKRIQAITRQSPHSIFFQFTEPRVVTHRVTFNSPQKSTEAETMDSNTQQHSF